MSRAHAYSGTIGSELKPITEIILIIIFIDNMYECTMYTIYIEYCIHYIHCCRFDFRFELILFAYYVKFICVGDWGLGNILLLFFRSISLLPFAYSIKKWIYSSSIFKYNEQSDSHEIVSMYKEHQEEDKIRWRIWNLCLCDGNLTKKNANTRRTPKTTKWRLRRNKKNNYEIGLGFGICLFFFFFFGEDDITFEKYFKNADNCVEPVNSRSTSSCWCLFDIDVLKLQSTFYYFVDRVA